MNKVSNTILAVSFWVWIVVPAAAHAADCKTATITSTAPDSRYTDNADGTVTDLITGLMWKQCSEGRSTTTTPCDTGTTTTYTWQAALQQAESVNSGGFAGYTDWRVPNRNELLSLVEFQCYQPSINRTFFPNVLSPWRSWSSSPNANNANTAWVAIFAAGNIMSDWKSTAYPARLVRGGL